jgi:hypothetical protein
LGELAINALVKGLTLAVFIVTFIRSINKIVAPTPGREVGYEGA